MIPCDRPCCNRTSTSCKHEMETADAEPSLPMRRPPKRKSGPKKGVVTACQHTDLALYALGMCNHCYHKYGRNGLATDCKHKGERKVYAKGKC